MKLLVIVEQTSRGYTAYSPDLPGCVAAGPSRDVVEERMDVAVRLLAVAVPKRARGRNC
jgi:predicted RNase H-like HicB family nuclease